MNRRSIRLWKYDYASPGSYFVTMCTHRRRALFGRIVGGVLIPSPLGETVAREWAHTVGLFPLVRSAAFVVMPNHVHGLLDIEAPNPDEQAHTHPLGMIVNGFKGAVTRRCRTGGNGTATVWQRGFHEHVVRSPRAYSAIRQYIEQNPRRWESDRLGRS